MRVKTTRRAGYKSVFRAIVNACKQEIIESARIEIGAISAAFMVAEAARLARYIQDHIDAYYNSYTPSKYYTRTDEVRNAVRPSANVIIMPDGKTLIAQVTIDEAPSTSVFPGGSSVDKVKAIDQGWEVKKDVFFRDWPHFGYQSGYGFIAKGIADFEKNNPHNILISPPSWI